MFLLILHVGTGGHEKKKDSAACHTRLLMRVFNVQPHQAAVLFDLADRKNALKISFNLIPILLSAVQSYLT